MTDSGAFYYPPTIHLGYLSDSAVVCYLRRARKYVRFVGPGISLEVAEALVNVWQTLGPHALQIVIEADSDLCRIGYCDAGALDLIQKTAAAFGCIVYRQSGVRLCVLEIDGERVIFPPAPRLVETGSKGSSEILLSPNTEVPLEEQILSPQEAHLSPLTDDAVAKVIEDIKSCPPQPFDLARQIRVFSTQFQFVEFGLQNAALSRKRAPVPSDLLGLAPDADAATKDLLRASFQLISKEDEASGESLMRQRSKIEATYTISLGDYGRVVRQDNRAAFEEAVSGLRKQIAAFKKEAATKLQSAIDQNAAAVVAQLLPIMRAKMPERWVARIGPYPTDEQLRKQLACEIEKAFGKPSVYLEQIKVRLVFKDITASMLQDSDFIEMARSKGLDLKALYEEYQAARIRA